MRTPKSKIRSAAQDYVFLRDRAIKHEDLDILSPLREEKCVWYSYEIYEYQRSGKSGSYVLIDSHSSDDPFTLEGPTGKCEVQPKGAEILANDMKTWKGFNIEGEGGPKKSLFSRLLRHLFAKYKFKETILKPRDKIYAFGMFSSKDGKHVLNKEGLTDDYKFVISNESPKKIARKLKQKGCFVLFGAIAAMIASFFI